MESKFIGDSCVDYNENENFFVRIPFNIIIDDKVFVDEKLNVDNLYLEMENAKESVKTSCPSPSLFLKEFDETKNNYVVTISSKLSGCYNSAITAKNIFLEEHPNAKIHIFDSKSCAAAENNIMLKIKELVDLGYSFEEVVLNVEKFIDELLGYSIFSRYDNLVKNGRIKSLVAKGVKLFNIYPIMGTKDGEIVLKHITKGKKMALHKIFKIFEESGKNLSECILTITSMKCHDTCDKLKQLIKEKFNFKDIIIYDALGLSTCYGDRGGIILSF